MKKIALSFLFALVLPLTANAQTQVLDRIVAVVNDDVILQSELDLAVKLLNLDITLNNEKRLREGQAAQRLPLPQELRDIALKRTISRKLVLQAGAVGQIRLSEQEIDDSIKQYVKSAGIDEGELKPRLARFDISIAEFRKDKEQELMATRIAQRMIIPNLSVTQQEVDNHIAGLITQGALRVRYNIALIYISIGDASDRKAVAEKLKLAESIEQQLAQGANFNEMAKKYSNHESAIRGGEMGMRNSTALPEVLQTALLRMKPGETSKVIHAADGYYIVYLRSSDNSAKLSRKDVEQDLFERKFYEQYNLLMIRLQNEAYIDIRI